MNYDELEINEIKKNGSGFYLVEIFEHGNTQNFVKHQKDLHEIGFSGYEDFVTADEIEPEKLPDLAYEIFESWAGEERTREEDREEFVKYLNENLYCDKKIIDKIVSEITWFKKYSVRYECGAEEEFEEESWKAAVEEVIERVQDGSYGDKSCYVNVRLSEENGEEESFDVLYNVEPKEPDCMDDHDHDWQSPKWLGGCTENPGVWGKSGAQITRTQVCVHCGYYRDYTSESTPGQLPKEPPTTEYREPNEISLEWIKEDNNV